MKRLPRYLLFIILAITPALVPAQEVQADEFRKTLEMADKYFSKGDYINAKASYQIAVKLNPEDPYSKQKLQESIGLIKIQMEKNALFTEKIMLADDLFRNKDYPSAVRLYQEGLDILPGDAYATRKIAEINQLLEDLKEAQQRYDGLIRTADQLFQGGQLEKALADYREASEIKPGESYPRERILSIESMLAEQKSRSGDYDLTLQAAEQYIQRNKYDEAIASLEAAIKIKPTEPFPKNRLAEAKQLRLKFSEYQQLIDAGDELYISRDFAGAKVKYLQASALNPGNAYPQEMMGKIDIALMDITTANEKSFEMAVAKADQYYNEQDYENAMEAYRQALSFKPGESYVQGRINDITNTLNLRRTQEEAYKQTVAKADQMMKESRFEEAKGLYTQAQDLKPLEQYPKVKLNEISVILAEFKNKQETYDKLIQGGDKLFFADNYPEAKEQYSKALELYPDSKYPVDQITMINQILGLRDTYTKAINRADQLLYEKDYQAAILEYRNAMAALPQEEYPSKKISEIETLVRKQAQLSAQLDSNYLAIIALAEDLLLKKDYPAARAKFEEASILKPLEALPKVKIQEIQRLVEQDAAARKLVKDYGALIAQADELFDDGEYSRSIQIYQAAHNLITVEKYPLDQIALAEEKMKEIASQKELQMRYDEALRRGAEYEAVASYRQALTAYNEAKSLKPSELLPQQKIDQINKILADLASKEKFEQDFLDLVKAADEAFNAKNYEEARTKYQAALNLKPDQVSITDKLRDVDNILAAIAKEKDDLKKYQDAIAYGDKHLAAEDYANARYEYQVANTFRPQEPYPLEKIAQIDAILAEQQRQKELNQQYAISIKEADALFRAEKFEEAITAYETSLKIKPGDIYAGKQIAEIKRVIASRVAEVEKSYGIAISKAENALNDQNYEIARQQFERALELKPNEEYPQEKLKEINEMIQKLRQINQEAYDKAIADADKFYASKIYDNAIESYRLAASLIPDEEYPKEMIRKILKLFSERAIVTINKDPLAIPNSITHKFEFTPVPVKDRKSNYLFFRAKNTSPVNHKLIISFGNGQSKNGGMVVKVPQGADYYEFVVRISAQYKWFSEDNNWITFYPEGGDLEVSLLQISYSD